MKKLMGVVIALLLIKGCARENESISYVKTDREEKVKLDSVKVPSVLLKEWVMVSNSNYLISLRKGKDTLLRVFDVNTLKYLGSFGKAGNGPEEFNGLNASALNIYNNDLHIKDRKKVAIVDISDMKNGNVIFKKNITLPEQFIRSNGNFMRKGAMYGKISIRPKKELQFASGDTIGNMLDFPTFPYVHEEARWHFFQGYSAISPNSDVYVKLYGRYPMFRIYDFSKFKDTTIYLKTKYPQKRIEYIDVKKVHLKNFRKVFHYSRSVYVTNKYIYLLSHIRTSEKVYEPKKLLIFNHNGDYIKSIVLKEWMNVMTPDYYDRYIYFLNPFVSDHIYRHKLDLGAK